jgi:outer membrane protein assembly factor BamB
VGGEVWCADLGRRLSKPRCYPTVAAGRYCLGTEDGTLLALELVSGELAWDRVLGGGEMAHALATDGERLFVGCEDVRPIPTRGEPLLALDARTGEEIWRFATDAHSLSAAAAERGTIHFTTSEGSLHAVDATNGKQRWVAEHPLWGPSPPAVAEGVVCAGGRGEMVVAYDAQDGRELWRFEADGWFASQPLIRDERIYAVCWDDHLYVLDTRSGSLLWKHKGERGKGLTTPAAVGHGSVFVGSRIYREREGRRIGGYALLSLNAEDGKENWRFHTEKHIFTPPAVANGLVFFGSRDGLFYAVDAATGEACWQMQVTSRSVTRPQVAGDLVIFGGRDGIVHAIRWRALPVEKLLDPEVYQQKGNLEETAVAYALQGSFEQAAVLYEKRLEKPRPAAQLYERAGVPRRAAIIWEDLGELPRARDAYREAGDKLGLARVLERLGQPLQAARLYEEIDNNEAAARLYEEAGDRTRAAELYRQLGMRERAIPIWRSLGDWERHAEDLIASGRLTEAARILEEHARLARAAELYLKAGDLESALRIERQRGQWESVAELAAKLGDDEQEATAYEQLGAARKAADAFQRAAERQAAVDPVDEEHVAALYEKAAKHYESLYREREMRDCRRQVRRYRRLPELVVRGRAEETFIECQWNVVRLAVENVGFGLARNVRVELSDSFDTRRQERIPGLPKSERRSLEVHARPREGEIGARVPVDIIVTYEDVRGRNYRLTQVESVRVLEAGRRLLGRETPLQLHIHGDLLEPGAKKVSGDEISGSGQKGDRVDIRRGAGSGVAMRSCDTGDRVEIRREGPPVRRCPECNLPVQDPGQRYCPDCGTPLDAKREDKSAEGPAT